MQTRFSLSHVAKVVAVDGRNHQGRSGVCPPRCAGGPRAASAASSKVGVDSVGVFEPESPPAVSAGHLIQFPGGRGVGCSVEEEEEAAGEERDAIEFIFCFFLRRGEKRGTNNNNININNNNTNHYNKYYEFVCLHHTIQKIYPGTRHQFSSDFDS